MEVNAAQSKCAGSRRFCRLQRNVCRLLHGKQITNMRSLLLPTTPAILPTTQKHFDWAVNGYEAWQNSLMCVFVRFFGLDRAQNTTRERDGYVIQPKCVSTKQKIVHGRGPSNIHVHVNLVIFVCSFKVCRVS